MNKFITILLIVIFNFSSLALAETMVNARTSIVIDYHSDKVLHEYEADIQIYHIDDQDYDHNHCF